ncbi:MAG: glycosyltransferase family 2 protein [Candidatus Thermoplasmatota archaeon]|jgi:glycosyltransferase involved in cell wall biosynthesis|nr:glycosyltransferase family 2 protein [Candidatus Thermoplasmatota archaeon]
MKSTIDSEEIYISIIITAFNRTKYLEKAIMSALNQDLDRKFFEIIVIKNFYQNSIDDLISSQSIISIYSDESNYGKWILQALKVARGEVVSFLEDDDLYDVKRMEVTYHKFTENKNLGFLKTGFSFFSDDNVSLKKVWREVTKPIYIRSGNELDLKDLLKINRYGINAVISAAAIRKSILISALKTFDSFYLFDYGLPYYALYQGYDVLALNNVLSYYRVSDSWTHIMTSDTDQFLNRKKLMLERTIDDFLKLRGFLNETNGYKLVLNYQLTKMQIEFRILSDDARGVDNIINYIELSIMDRNPKRIGSLLLLPIYKINKGIARKLYFIMSS